MTKDNIDPKIISSLNYGMFQTFIVQMGTSINVVEPDASKAQDLSHAKPNVIAILGISSSTYMGTLILGFDERVFLAVVRRLIDESFDKINSNNADCAGEILNIIFGVAKVALNEAGYGFGAALPSVSFGKNIRFETLQNSGQASTRLFYKGDIGEFFLDVRLSRVPDGEEV